MVTTAKVDFGSVGWGSVEWTNLVTLYLRAYESRSPRPILGDHAAAEALERIDYDFKGLHRAAQPWANQFLVALRAKKLDDWTADFVGRHPDAVVLHLGCGLDTRAFRIQPPPTVQWFDLDQSGVIELRRKVYDETDAYRMIGSSVNDPGWLEQIPTGRPTLVVAEGLVMYLTEREVRELLQRLTDRFGNGGLLFDTLSPAGPRLSKLFTNGIVKWGLRDAREIERWKPGLRFVEQVSTIAGYESIPFTPQRLVYRLMWATPMRNYDVLNRFEF
ncbi:class I SAM-dependent methyltransferase [Mycobacterium sp. MMS18-G62]